MLFAGFQRVRAKSTEVSDESTETSFKDTVPESFQDEWTAENDHLILDAQVVVPEEEITVGMVEEVPVDENLIRKVLLKEDENEIIEIESESGRQLIVEDKLHEIDSPLGLKYSCLMTDSQHRFDFTDHIEDNKTNNRNDVFINPVDLTEKDQQAREKYETQMLQILEQLGINKGIQKIDLFKNDAGYNSTVTASTLIGNTASYPLYLYAMEGSYIEDGCSAQFNNESMWVMYNVKNYQVSDSEKAELLPFDTIITTAKQLFEHQIISNLTVDQISSKYSINRIQLTYVLKNSDNGSIYRPIWVFEKNISELNGYVPFFVIDAQTGELELYSNFGL